MAAPLKLKSAFSRLHTSTAFQSSTLAVLQRQLSVSSFLPKSWKPKVCESPDKSMVMCWHPEPEFPYEHTQPLPRDKTEITKGESVLKVQYLLDDKLKNRPDGPTDEELAKMFHVTKFTFRPRPRYEKRIRMRPYTPKDREGI